MKFCWSTLNVKNMEESLKFYEEVVGLTLDQRFQAGPGKEIAFLGDGETKIELIHNADNGDIDIGKDISWGFKVNSLDEMVHFITEKGIAIEDGPYQPNPNTKFFYVLDPNGLRIQFVETL